MTFSRPLLSITKWVSYLLHVFIKTLKTEIAKAQKFTVRV